MNLPTKIDRAVGGANGQSYVARHTGNCFGRHGFKRHISRDWCSSVPVAGGAWLEYFAVQSRMLAVVKLCVAREVVMKKWLRRVRGAIGIGLTWAFGWAVAGVLIGVASILLPGLPWDAFFEVFDAPLPAFAIPGFFAGVFFSAVLGIAGRRRSFRELSLLQFAAWGAVGGVLLILFPFALVAVGLASREGSDVGTWQIIAVIAGPFILLSAVSASVTLILARIAERRGWRDAIHEAAV